MLPNFVVSIINYKTCDMTIECMASVLEAASGHDVHIGVVDNHSEDGSAEKLEAWVAASPHSAQITVFRSPVNSGFSGGHNYVMSRLPARSYLVLNSDALIRPGFFQHMENALAANARTGLIAPRIDSEDGSPQISCFRFPNPLSEFMRAARTGPLTRALQSYQVALGPEPNPAQIEWASFACILLRGEMVQELGPMDEGYFLYFEDVEYALRARRAGWQIDYVPEARAVHFRGGSGPVKSLMSERKRLPKYYYASRTRFLYQAYGRLGLTAANTLWYVGRVIAQLSLLRLKRRRTRAKAEWRDIWINYMQPLGPRYGTGE